MDLMDMEIMNKNGELDKKIVKMIKAEYEARGGNWDDIKQAVKTYPLLIETVLFIGYLYNRLGNSRKDRDD